MNAEQKQRALTALGMWHSSNDSSQRECQAAELMASLLQEIVDAPEAEPVLVVKVEPDYWHRGHYCEGSKPYINPLEVWKLPVGTKLYAAPTQAEPPADVARDAERYRWLRDPSTDVATVIDKKVGWLEYDEGTKTGGYGIYEYRGGDELDEAIDAAIERDKLKGGEA